MTITTKYAGPTNTQGSRVIATDNDGNRVSLGYASELNSDQNHDRAAIALVRKMKRNGTLVRGSMARGYVYVFAAFGSIVEVQPNDEN